MTFQLVPTFSLLIYLGYLPPVMQPGFLTEESCEEAGKAALVEFDLCHSKETTRKCKFECIPGPPRTVPDTDEILD